MRLRAVQAAYIAYVQSVGGCVAACIPLSGGTHVQCSLALDPTMCRQAAPRRRGLCAFFCSYVAQCSVISRLNAPQRTVSHNRKIQWFMPCHATTMRGPCDMHQLILRRAAIMTPSSDDGADLGFGCMEYMLTNIKSRDTRAGGARPSIWWCRVFLVWYEWNYLMMQFISD